jgi:glycosyltransferase involved in cell wall biosynthesis
MGSTARGAGPVRIFFLIRSLNYGGAQRQLTNLVRSLDKSRFTITVASFYDGGGLRAELERVPGVRVISLHKGGRWDMLPFFLRLMAALREARPQVIHGYLSGANELVLLAGRLVGARVVWGLRSAMREGGADDWLARLIFRGGAWLSHFTDLIIANSHAGRQFHIGQRYAGRRIEVIHNGIDAARFQPCPQAGASLRHAWGVPDGAALVGTVGRLDPQKDHPTFLRAAALLAARRPGLRFVCVGAGDEAYGGGLRRLAGELGLADRITWAGAHSDMPAVYSALDLCVSSSLSEGFANVLGEAMACGVPCVTTDAGDSALVVGDPARVVPPSDPQALAGAIERVLDLPSTERAAIGQRSRERIEGEFSVPALTRRTEAMFQRIA